MSTLCFKEWLKIITNVAIVIALVEKWCDYSGGLSVSVCEVTLCDIGQHKYTRVWLVSPSSLLKVTVCIISVNESVV